MSSREEERDPFDRVEDDAPRRFPWFYVNAYAQRKYGADRVIVAVVAYNSDGVYCGHLRVSREYVVEFTSLFGWEADDTEEGITETIKFLSEMTVDRVRHYVASSSGNVMSRITVGDVRPTLEPSVEEGMTRTAEMYGLEFPE